VRDATAASCQSFCHTLLHGQLLAPRLTLLYALQTAKGTAAKRLSTEEWVDRVVVPWADTLPELMHQHPGTYRQGVAYFSCDNATWHNRKAFERATSSVKGVTIRLLPPPPLSPDLHKIPEHMINNFEGALNSYLMDNPDIRRVEEIKQAAQDVWAKLDVAGVRKDIRSLVYTYRAVRLPPEKGGFGGSWPAKQFRCGAPVLPG
jgi:hypothetical protein